MLCFCSSLKCGENVAEMLFLHCFGAEYRRDICKKLAGDNFSTDASQKLRDSDFMP